MLLPLEFCIISSFCDVLFVLWLLFPLVWTAVGQVMVRGVFLLCLLVLFSLFFFVVVLFLLLLFFVLFWVFCVFVVVVCFWLFFVCLFCFCFVFVFCFVLLSFFFFFFFLGGGGGGVLVCVRFWGRGLWCACCFFFLFVCFCFAGDESGVVWSCADFAFSVALPCCSSLLHSWGSVSSVVAKACKPRAFVCRRTGSPNQLGLMLTLNIRLCWALTQSYLRVSISPDWYGLLVLQHLLIIYHVERYLQLFLLVFVSSFGAKATKAGLVGYKLLYSSGIIK